MTDLYVDADALKELASQLRGIKEALESAKDDFNAYDGRLGSKKIEGALDGFVSDWRDGRKKIIEGIDGLLARIKGAAEAYREQEAALSKAAGGSA